MTKMRSEKLAIVLLTVIVMAEAKVCYKYHRLVNGSFDCVNGTRNETTPCTSYRLGGVSLGQGTATGGALTNGNTSPSSSKQSQSVSTTDVSLSTTETVETTDRLTLTNGNTPPSSSQEAQSDSTTDVPPSTSETIENAPRCNSFIVAGKNYSMAKNACGEIGGKMFGYEHVQSNETAEETFRDLMRTHNESSSCQYVWVDIIRKDDNQFEWSGGPDFVDSDSWWGKNQPGNSEECVAGQRYDDWKLHDVHCTSWLCTMCMDALCNSG
ncbi:hypothetical protein BSL78_09739 [Apostichopus japonicus]|uniref:C-type lectin domain-containing protein n=1 Tax=Stichopus japonicus TaxID=307972 RepID=A0A2G8KZF5_STIJA|nr:hypothetical protein BSL78_09739 [Apostichopus japonicus]